MGSTPRHASGVGQGGGMCGCGGAQQPERLRERNSCSASMIGQGDTCTASQPKRTGDPPVRGQRRRARSMGATRTTDSRTAASDFLS